MILLIIGISFLVLGLLSIIFWFWMLVDLLQRKNFKDKLVWLLVLIFLCILGAILYYFLVCRKTKSPKKKK